MLQKYQSTSTLHLFELVYSFKEIFPASFLIGMAVAVRVPSTSEIKLFNHLLRIITISFLKQRRCV